MLFIYVSFLLFSSYCMEFTPGYLISLFIFMTVVSLGCLIICYRIIHISCFDSKQNKGTYKKLNKSKFYKLDNCPIYTTENSNGYAAVIEEVYESLNENQRNIFENKGFCIIVGSKEELRLFSKEHFINGYFSKVGKYILLFTDCEITKDKPYVVKPLTITSFRSTFYHEWGHFVDFACNSISETFKFRSYYGNEKAKFVNSVRLLYSGMPSFYLKRNPQKNLYELKNSSEFFACKYSEYKRGVILPDYLNEVFNKVEMI